MIQMYEKTFQEVLVKEADTCQEMVKKEVMAAIFLHGVDKCLPFYGETTNFLNTYSQTMRQQNKVKAYRSEEGMDFAQMSKEKRYYLQALQRKGHYA